MATNNFRFDINGLRAWAVVSVILFHFDIAGFSGGFIGVDIFFVISGFLMTSIIVNGLAQERKVKPFSLISFYVARFRRIVPALLFVCALLFVLGWLCLPAGEFSSLSIHIFSALFFLSNIKFLRESGYFDVASHEKWLLHTWSLSVEWQFYLLLPLLLLFCWKLKPSIRFLFCITAGLSVISFAFSFYLSILTPNAAFYLLHTRAWEMLLGGIVFFLANKNRLSDKAKTITQGVGFLLIMTSIACFDSNTPWPGYAALLPVIGTFFVIWANKSDSIFTSASLIQWLGTRSYSLYLWHWPFAVFLNYMGILDNNVAVLIAIISTALVAHFSYIWIELSFQNKSVGTLFSSQLFMLITLTCVIAGTGLYVRQQAGLPGRLPAEIEQIFAESENINPRRKECHAYDAKDVPECTYGGPTLGVIVIGDSHAASVVRSVENSLPSSELHVLDWTLNSCPTIAGVKQRNAPAFNCGDFVENAIEVSKKFPAEVPLLIVNRLTFYIENQFKYGGGNSNYLYYVEHHGIKSDLTDAYISTVCSFQQYRQVYILSPVPEYSSAVPNTIGRYKMFGADSRMQISLDEHLLYHRKANELIFQAKKCGVKVLDPLPYMCEGHTCYADKDGRPKYYDDDHLSEFGSKLLVPIFSTMFEHDK